MAHINDIFQQVQETIGQMLKDPAKYVRFLETASNNYSNSFMNQILIYANKPEARAVATYEEWNKRYNRYVNKGAKSFYILDQKNKSGIKRVLDYFDTNRFDGEEVYFWKVDEKNSLAMQKILTEYGYLNEENGEIRLLTGRIKEEATWYELELREEDNGLYKYVRASVYALLMARTAPEQFRQVEDFIDLSDFNYIKELDVDSVRLIGNLIRTYVSAVFARMRAMDKEVRENAAEQDLRSINQQTEKQEGSEAPKGVIDSESAEFSEMNGPENAEFSEVADMGSGEEGPERSESLESMESEEEKSGSGEMDSGDVRGEHLAEKQNDKDIDNVWRGRGKKEKYRRNMDAVRTLKRIEEEGRMATKEEKRVLAGYAGWGGISEVFDCADNGWGREYQELKNILSADEYRNARESVLSAFYTPSVIIKTIYKVLGKYGFSEGCILEPSCGTGNFFGMLPEQMKKSKLYGVEVDSITGRIAMQLYPNARITVDGYENTDFPDQFFDVAVGNVPFGQYTVSDQNYNKYGFLIHDYFFVKTLDKIRAGGIIAFVTSKGTLDKKRNDVRRYLAERAEFLGAIRLPSDIFKESAGTETVTDIIFLKKRDNMIDYYTLTEEEQEWTYVGYNADGFLMNEYFVHHPEMIMGTPQMITGRFGQTLDIKAKESGDFESDLESVIKNLPDYTIPERKTKLPKDTLNKDTIPAAPEIRNNSYAVVKDEVYYREDDVMVKVVDKSRSVLAKIRQMVRIRNQLYKVIDLQVKNAVDEELAAAQKELGKDYDDFYNRFGSITNNIRHFQKDSSHTLISTLEKLDAKGKVTGKSDIFYKRTISPDKKIEHVDSSEEALVVCYREKGIVDLGYMRSLSGKSSSELIRDLKGQIYPLPGSEYEDKETNETLYVYQLESEYLSGNVREKLREINRYLEKADAAPVFEQNRSALDAVQPKDLESSEITAKLGTNWIPAEYYTEFLHEIMETRGYRKRYIYVEYEPLSNNWMVVGRQLDMHSINSTKVWGTGRRDAYEIMEACLNQRVLEVTDTIKDTDGKRRQVKNPEETIRVQEKQNKFQEAFAEWIWNDYERREHLTRLYNEKFNSVVPRRYDGKFVKLTNCNVEVKLRPHQLDAVAHALYGGNTLFDHAVGAGKTFEIIATAMESKRLGLCSKPVIAVPNHLTMQVGQDFLKMYPGANILIANKKTFEKKNRKKFCSRIATGDWDCVIMAHSQLEKIPLSKERQEKHIRDEIETYAEAVVEARSRQGDSISVKALEASKKMLEAKLRKLQDDTRKDDVVTFEELGVDKLIVDEAHEFKNLDFPTKMSNINGIGGAKSYKATDLYLKVRYLNEKTDYKGVTFATGTPISNSLCELFVMQKYLQEDRLKQNGIDYFDSWASVFGSVETSLELKPEGNGYQMKSRFCKYQNIPELLCMFHEIADVKTAEMLNLPVPEVEEINVVVKRTEFQKEFIEQLGERAEEIRKGNVTSNIDNMLVVTNDGRKAALDQRLIDPLAPDDPQSKVNTCINNLYTIYKETEEERLTQIVFCDLSTPKKDGSFNVYDDIKKKLIANGVKEDEIAFIQDAGTGTQADKKKEEIFGKAREGKIRILIGSTFMMGTGANIQDRLYALHNLDCPWRPADMEQRAGRIKRYGNMNKCARIYKYITQGTFDAYMFQILELKQKFISQIQNGTAGRTCNVEEDKAALNYAETKALCTENPLIKEKMNLDIAVARLRRLAAQHKNECYMIERKVRKELPEQVQKYRKLIQNISADMVTAQENTIASAECQSIKIKGQFFDSDASATKELVRIARNMDKNTIMEIGEYRGFKLSLSYNLFNEDYQVFLMGASGMGIKMGAIGVLKKLDHEIDRLSERKACLENQLQQAETDLENGREKINIPFAHEEELKEKTARLEELDKILDQMNRGTANATINEKEETEKEDREEFLTEEDFEHDQRQIINESGYETGKNYPVVNRRDNEWTR